VNKLSDRHRNKIIERDYPALRDDLTKLTPDRSVPVILFKVNEVRFHRSRKIQSRRNRNADLFHLGHVNRWQSGFRHGSK
jgi:hypothetical protein